MEGKLSAEALAIRLVCVIAFLKIMSCVNILPPFFNLETSTTFSQMNRVGFSGSFNMSAIVTKNYTCDQYLISFTF
jgi:hypothetical protein